MHYTRQKEGDERMTDYRLSYQRFLKTRAWSETKAKVLAKRRRKWNKKGLYIDNEHFKCEKCKRILPLYIANYHHKRYKNRWTGSLGWSNPSNVIIICKMCHEHIHRKKIKRMKVRF